MSFVNSCLSQFLITPLHQFIYQQQIKMRNNHFLSPAKMNNPILIQDNEKRRYLTQSSHKGKTARTIPITVQNSTQEQSTTNRSPRKIPKSFLSARLNIPLPITKKSNKPIPPIVSYSVSTHHGLYHLINEDKISIHFSRYFIFSIFDGYGGTYAAEFLKQNMLIDIMHNPEKDNTQKLLLQTFQKIDKKLLEQQKKMSDKSGSSAIVCLIYKKILYIANCGTSLCIGKTKNKQILKLNNLHNCDNINQYARVTSEGARLYQTKITIEYSPTKFAEGPLRVYPYGLKATRTMGNIEVKSKTSTTNNSVIIGKPEIKYINVEQLQWICICSEGLLTVMSQSEINKIIQQNFKNQILNQHEYADKCVQQIMTTALSKGCNNNLSVIVLIFKQKQVKIPDPPKKTMSKTVSLKYIGGKSTVVQQH